ncbi:MG406 family protein [Mesoplasma corruscae]|uniref:MG406 family protein n=1 Tax=Mesoplasma corruscae TaxID=216874 RepID=A0A2S5RH08_9MOLU|nr:hypothetical protein MCORR_v1c02080 [Mesoplasma corruscae]
MELKNNFKKNWFLNNKILLGLLTYIVCSSMVLFILWVANVLSYSWLLGLLLSFTSVLLVLWIAKKSFNVIVRTENHFLFYFLFLLKVGIYATPLFIAFLNVNYIFHINGVMIGFISLIFIPFINLQVNNNLTNKEV